MGKVPTKISNFYDAPHRRLTAQLKRAKKIRLDESGWRLIKISPANQLMLQSPGLLPKPEQEEKQRPGRPKKSI